MCEPRILQVWDCENSTRFFFFFFFFFTIGPNEFLCLKFVKKEAECQTSRLSVLYSTIWSNLQFSHVDIHPILPVRN